MLEFHLDARSGVPTYLQLVQQVKQAVRLGILVEGDQLPTVKEVVGHLAINPNTVLKAYRDRECLGLVEGRQGVGTFVMRRPDGPPPNEQAALKRTLTAWVARAQRAGLADANIESMVRAVLATSAAEAIA